MNDRYLFRAKQLGNGKWVIGYLCPPAYPGYIGNCWHIAVEEEYESGYQGKTWLYIEIDPATICQCTGLKDTNGKLIFEGDILQYSNKAPVVIRFSNDSYYADIARLYEYINIHSRLKGKMDEGYYVEVVSNIYDNLKVPEDTQ